MMVSFLNSLEFVSLCFYYSDSEGMDRKGICQRRQRKRGTYPKFALGGEV